MSVHDVVCGSCCLENVHTDPLAHLWINLLGYVVNLWLAKTGSPDPHPFNGVRVKLPEYTFIHHLFMRRVAGFGLDVV